MAKKWYALRVVSGQENKISQLVRVMVEHEELSSHIGKTYIPMYESSRMRGGKHYTQKQRVVPGYVLIEIDMPTQGWRDVVTGMRTIDGVIGFASVTSAGDKPKPLTEEETRMMLSYGKDGATSPIVRSRQRFSKGEVVKIKSGLFNFCEGTVEEVDVDKATLKVVVGIFNRSLSIDLKHDEVEKV